MMCKHQCPECALPYFEDCETLPEAQEYGFACNDLCSQCEPEAQEERTNEIREEELAMA